MNYLKVGQGAVVGRVSRVPALARSRDCKINTEKDCHQPLPYSDIAKRKLSTVLLCSASERCRILETISVKIKVKTAVPLGGRS